MNNKQESQNAPIIIKNEKKRFKVYPIFIVLLSIMLLVSATFNVLSILSVKNVESTISVTLDGESVGGEMLVGESYVCEVTLKNKNFSFIEKVGKVKIEVKKAGIFKEIGNFNNIDFEDFKYSKKSNMYTAYTDVSVNAFSEEESKISFNFSPSASGIGDLEIRVYFEGELIESFVNSDVKLFI